MTTFKSNGYMMTVPVLHRAYYSPKEDWTAVYRWCKENCKGRCYTSPSWAGYFVEFEDDEDMVWFGLRWS